MLCVIKQAPLSLKIYTISSRTQPNIDFKNIHVTTLCVLKVFYCYGNKVPQIWQFVNECITLQLWGPKAEVGFPGLTSRCRWLGGGSASMRFPVSVGHHSRVPKGRVLAAWSASLPWRKVLRPSGDNPVIALGPPGCTRMFSPSPGLQPKSDLQMPSPCMGASMFTGPSIQCGHWGTSPSGVHIGAQTSLSQPFPLR